MRDQEGVYVVLLNWNGWRDTIACLGSLLPDISRGARVIVCDNDSADDSLTHIHAWAKGELHTDSENSPRLDRLQRHGLAAPRVQRLTREDAELGRADPAAQLLLVDNGANLGFAAGNNVGLRLAMHMPEMTQAWLLNNDTLVEADCLSMMRQRLLDHGRPAVCGSIIHFFDRPEIIQCIGGNRFDRQRGRARQSEGRYLSESQLPAMGSVEERLDYLSGCSVLLPRDFLQSVGLMNEDYFLYYEEIDWFTRAGSRFDLLVANDAHIYHREGGSIGSPSGFRGPSLLSDLHMFRSRIRFMRRYYPQSMWRCTLGNWADVLKRLARGQWRNAAVVASVIIGIRSRARSV